MKNTLFLLLIALVLYLAPVSQAQKSYCSWASSSGNAIAKKSVSYVGSTLWAYASNRKTGKNTNKCNIFVAEVIEGVGKSVPHRRWWLWTPIGAREWANPSSTYLTKDKCWSLVTGCYMRGDVAAAGGHVGIVTGKDTTTSAAHNSVVMNDWGFRAGQRPTFWRYTC